MTVQRNFINQNPNGKFGRWNVNSIDPDEVKLFFQHTQPHKHFEVIVRDGDLVVHGDISCNGTIYDTSGNDLVAQVKANTIAAALANSNATYAINQTGINATNIDANVGFINQNIGAIAANTLSASSNSGLITALETVQNTQRITIEANSSEIVDNTADILLNTNAITANSSEIEVNTADILLNTNAITAHDASINRLDTRFSSDLVDIVTDSNGEYAEMLVSTGATDTNDMRLTFRPEPNTGTQELLLILDDNTRFGGTAVNILDRFILTRGGFWAKLKVGTGNSILSRFYFQAEDTNKPLTVYIEGNLVVSGTYPSSDDRIKNNEKVIENATETLMKLTPQIYDKYENMDCSGNYTTECGLIAQEVYYNAPELRHSVLLGLDSSGQQIVPDEMDLSNINIGEDPDYSNHGWSDVEHSSLNYNSLIGYLIKSNQELNERLTKLEQS